VESSPDMFANPTATFGEDGTGFGYVYTGSSQGAGVGSSNGDEKRSIEEAAGEVLTIERSNLGRSFAGLQLGVNVLQEGTTIKVEAFDSSGLIATDYAEDLGPGAQDVAFFQDQTLGADGFKISASDNPENPGNPENPENVAGVFQIDGKQNTLFYLQPSKTGEIREGETTSFETAFPPVRSEVTFESTSNCNVDSTKIEYTINHAFEDDPNAGLYPYSAQWVVPGKTDPYDPTPDDPESGDETKVGNCLFDWTTTMTGVGYSLTPLIDFSDTGFTAADALPACETSPSATTYSEDGLTPIDGFYYPTLPEAALPACLVTDSYDAATDVKTTRVLLWNDPYRF